jgi:hypothetical protein
MDKETKQQFELINRKLNALAAGQRKETWVSVIWIQKITGWNKEDLKRARDQKIIEYKREGKDWLYLLESVPDRFLIQKQAS